MVVVVVVVGRSSEQYIDEKGQRDRRREFRRVSEKCNSILLEEILTEVFRRVCCRCGCFRLNKSSFIRNCLLIDAGVKSQPSSR